MDKRGGVKLNKLSHYKLCSLPLLRMGLFFLMEQVMDRCKPRFLQRAHQLVIILLGQSFLRDLHLCFCQFTSSPLGH